MNKILKLFTLAASLPFIYGCGGGGGGGDLSALTSTLFGADSGGSEIVSGAAAVIPEVGGAAVQTLTNPEPTSLLLLGSGLIASAYFSRKK